MKKKGMHSSSSSKDYQTFQKSSHHGLIKLIVVDGMEFDATA
jgi:hypothetical protein